MRQFLTPTWTPGPLTFVCAKRVRTREHALTLSARSKCFASETRRRSETLAALSGIASISIDAR